MSDQPKAMSRQTPSPLRIVSSRKEATTAAPEANVAAPAVPARASLSLDQLSQSLGQLAEALQAAESTQGATAVAVSSLSSLSTPTQKKKVGGLTVKREPQS